MVSLAEYITHNQIASTIATLVFLTTAWHLFYNICLHPLRKFPGPASHSISRLPVVVQLWRGKLAYHLQDLHSRYGLVVRTAPNELSFLDPAAWRDIYGRQSGLASGVPEIPKWERFYRLHKTKGQTTIMNANCELHALLRRQLAHGFSERSLREQEGIIGGYVDLLIQGLRQNSGNVIDITMWYAWATFDIIGDLALGSSFKCLEKQDWHPWVKQFLSSSREFSIISGLRMLGLDCLVGVMMSRGMPARKSIFAMTAQALKRRLENPERSDLIEGMLQTSESERLDFEVVHGTARSLISAGSETTATLLSGITFLLLTNAQAYEKIQREVRSCFTSENEITLVSLNKLPYMTACVNEAMRLYPPIPAGLPRYTGSGGVFIAGHSVPENTVVYVPHVAMYRSPRHWTQPNEYCPERFLDGSDFANDHFDALQPFSVGPRNCIGMNLAFAEARLILARVLFSFDLELATESRKWLEKQEVYLLWRKPALNVKITERMQINE